MLSRACLPDTQRVVEPGWGTPPQDARLGHARGGLGGGPGDVARANRRVRTWGRATLARLSERTSPPSPAHGVVALTRPRRMRRSDAKMRKAKGEDGSIGSVEGALGEFRLQRHFKHKLRSPRAIRSRPTASMPPRSRERRRSGAPPEDKMLEWCRVLETRPDVRRKGCARKSALVASAWRPRATRRYSSGCGSTWTESSTPRRGSKTSRSVTSSRPRHTRREPRGGPLAGA